MRLGYSAGLRSIRPMGKRTRHSEHGMGGAPGPVAACLPACLPWLLRRLLPCYRRSIHREGGSFVAFLPTAIPCKGCSHRPFHFAPCLLALLLFFVVVVFSFLSERCPGHAGFEGLHIPCRRSSVAACTCYVAGGIRAASDIFSLFSRLAVTFRCRRNAVAALYPA